MKEQIIATIQKQYGLSLNTINRIMTADMYELLNQWMDDYVNNGASYQEALFDSINGLMGALGYDK